jgi:hypothetical protein
MGRKEEEEETHGKSCFQLFVQFFKGTIAFVYMDDSALLSIPVS